VSDAELAPYLALVEAKLADHRSFEQSVRVGLAAILTSPDFLFFRETPGQLDDFALASRLSYFLWSSMPDDELLGLAERGELHEPAVLRKQVDRLLKSREGSGLRAEFRRAVARSALRSMPRSRVSSSTRNSTTC
jgi:hypothetical protein